MAAPDPLGPLVTLRQHQQGGHRSPHKPLLVLLALAQLARTGSSRLSWADVHDTLADLIAEFAPPSRTGRVQAAAYPFTRLRSDGVWHLSADVPMDKVAPLGDNAVTGQFAAGLEAVLRADPELVRAAARALVESNWPPTVAPDVLAAAGLDPDLVLTPSLPREAAGVRRRGAGWRAAVLQAWDRQCAFCGYDGQLGTATAGIDAAHVRWFAFDGPETLDNGLALCALHHKLFDLGVLGLDTELRLQVSRSYTARTAAGRAVYDLHAQPLQPPRPGTMLPAAAHVSWHAREVFKGAALAA